MIGSHAHTVVPVEDNVFTDYVNVKKDGTRQIVLNAPVLEIVVDMVVVWMVFVNVKTNGLDLTVQSNQHQNVKKHVLRHAKRIVQKVMTAQMQDNVVLKIVLKRIATHRNLTFVVYHQWKAW